MRNQVSRPSRCFPGEEQPSAPNVDAYSSRKRKRSAPDHGNGQATPCDGPTLALNYENSKPQQKTNQQSRRLAETNAARSNLSTTAEAGTHGLGIEETSFRATDLDLEHPYPSTQLSSSLLTGDRPTTSHQTLKSASTTGWTASRLSGIHHSSTNSESGSGDEEEHEDSSEDGADSTDHSDYDEMLKLMAVIQQQPERASVSRQKDRAAPKNHAEDGKKRDKYGLDFKTPSRSYPEGIGRLQLAKLGPFRDPTEQDYHGWWRRIQGYYDMKKADTFIGFRKIGYYAWKGSEAAGERAYQEDQEWVSQHRRSIAARKRQFKARNIAENGFRVRKSNKKSKVRSTKQLRSTKTKGRKQGDPENDPPSSDDEYESDRTDKTGDRDEDYMGGENWDYNNQRTDRSDEVGRQGSSTGQTDSEEELRFFADDFSAENEELREEGAITSGLACSEADTGGREPRSNDLPWLTFPNGVSAADARRLAQEYRPVSTGSGNEVGSGRWPGFRYSQTMAGHRANLRAGISEQPPPRKQGYH